MFTNELNQMEEIFSWCSLDDPYLLFIVWNFNNNFHDLLCSYAFEVRDEYKEIMTYLESVAEVKVESEIAHLTFSDVVEMQKLLSVSNFVNKKITDAVKQRIKDGECKISCDQLYCNALAVYPSEYYVNSKNIAREVCPHIQTLIIADTSKDIPNFHLWDDCLEAAESVLENLYIDLPQNTILNAAYITFLKFTQRTFPKLAILSVGRWIDGILDIGKICPANRLAILRLSSSDINLIQWEKRPLVLEVDATACTNVDRLFALERKIPRQAWTNPSNNNYLLDYVHNYEELSVRNGKEYFYYKNEPYILASNMIESIQIMKDLNVMRDFIQQHLFIDDVKSDQIDMTALQTEKKIIHLTIFTSEEPFFETIIDEHVTSKYN